MPIREELRQIIAILEEEGFGALAGEVLSEISLGREVERARSGALPGDHESDGQNTIVVRIPFEEEEQLVAALDILRLRLVEPARVFAEAERIANELAPGRDVRIRFVDPIEGDEIEPSSSSSLSETAVAESLYELFARLPSMVDPPASGEV